MTKEEEILRRHMLDLADQAWRRDIPVFTDFLNLHEQNIFHSLSSQLDFIHCRLFGGYEQAERQMLGFLPDAFCFDEESERSCFPIGVVDFRPLNAKFSDALTHRDYLGAMMNLGIDRAVTGDIIVDADHAAVICRQDMAQLIADELTRVRHTSVMGMCTDLSGLKQTLHTRKVTGSVASVRLDALLSTAFPQARAALAARIEAKEVFVDSVLVTKPSYTPQEGAVISVRGMGRFRYMGIEGNTRKGRLMVTLELYT